LSSCRLLEQTGSSNVAPGNLTCIWVPVVQLNMNELEKDQCCMLSLLSELYTFN
jgi:hypothetical protein